LIQDLAVYEKQIYFWNWKKESFHLVMRFNREYFELFKFGALHDVVKSEIIQIKGTNTGQQLSDVSVN
jgi:hypothetical protein